MIGSLGSKTKNKKLAIGGEEIFGTAYDKNVVRRIVLYLMVIFRVLLWCLGYSLFWLY